MLVPPLPLTVELATKILKCSELIGSSNKAPVTSRVAPQGLYRSHWPILHPDLPIGYVHLSRVFDNSVRETSPLSANFPLSESRTQRRMSRLDRLAQG
jgi:hypothetical protein